MIVLQSKTSMKKALVILLGLFLISKCVNKASAAASERYRASGFYELSKERAPTNDNNKNQ